MDAGSGPPVSRCNMPLNFMQRTILTLTAALACLSLSQAQPKSDREQILLVEEQFRVAKLKNDTATLDRIVADDFLSINQYGAKRDKARLIELWTSFPIQSLVIGSSDVRITGD